MLTGSTRTAGVRRRRFAQIFDATFRLSHTCCFGSGRCGCVCNHYVLKSFPAFCGVSRAQTSAIRRSFTDVDIAGPFVATVVGFSRSRFNVWQLWDDQHWLKQICRNIAWVRLPKRSTDTLQQSVVGLVSRIEQHRSQSRP